MYLLEAAMLKHTQTR